MTTKSSRLDHPTLDLLRRYASGRDDIRPDTLWAVEAHLTGCSPCRNRLGEVVVGGESVTAALVERVRAELDIRVAGDLTPTGTRVGPRSRALVLRWLTPALVPWIVMMVLVVLAAVAFDLLAEANAGRLPSLVLLVAPVTPLIGVAAAWTQGRDPAYEIVAATPRAGLHLVFRRTLAVLTVAMPVLVGAGLVVDKSPARWLLPCLAFVLGALALAEVVGLRRAATGLVLLWVAVVIVPSLALARVPVVLESANHPAWVAFATVAAAILGLRRVAFTRLSSGR